MAKITTFLIGLVFIGIFITIISNFIGHVSDGYGQTYNDSELEVYNRIESITNDTEEIKTSVESVSEKTGILDIIGSFFSDAYKAAKITLGSFGVFEAMTSHAVDDIGMGENAGALKSGLITAALILIIVGVFIAAMLKWPV